MKKHFETITFNKRLILNKYTNKITAEVDLLGGDFHINDISWHPPIAKQNKLELKLSENSSKDTPMYRIREPGKTHTIDSQLIFSDNFIITVNSSEKFNHDIYIQIRISGILVKNEEVIKEPILTPKNMHGLYTPITIPTHWSEELKNAFIENFRRIDEKYDNEIFALKEAWKNRKPLYTDNSVLDEDLPSPKSDSYKEDQEIEETPQENSILNRKVNGYTILAAIGTVTILEIMAFLILL